MIYNMDCIEGSKLFFEDESADLFIADPPFNLGFGGTTQTRTKRPRFSVIANDKLSHRDYQRFTFAWLREAYRILKPGRHAYICIDWRMYPYMALWMRKVGFTIKNCIVWDKQKFGMGWQYRYRHEFVIFATKGHYKARRIRTRSASDVLSIPKIPGNKTVHPTEKPVELMELFIHNSTEEGERIVDFFVGSGPVPKAAMNLNRKFDGFEIDPIHFHTTMNRLSSNQPEEKTPKRRSRPRVRDRVRMSKL